MRRFALWSVMVCAVLLVSAVSASGEPRVWTGLEMTFEKEDYADWTLPENQDRITDKVIVTRAAVKGIYNVVTEDGYRPSPPAGTEWANGHAADWQSLRFLSWESWNRRVPPDFMLGFDAVLHLIQEDVYLDIKFTSWTQNAEGGGFTYVRATEGVPGEKVWTGTPTTFTKEDYADWTQAANQDRLSENVWITRRDKEGLFNINQEREYRLHPPSGTQWAFGTASNWQSLSFEPWEDLAGDAPADLVGQDMVVHLLDADAYVDVKFTSWSTDAEGGGFAYERATEKVPGEKVWSGSKKTFTRANGADWTLPANQDRLTDDVWITRGRWDGIFNIANETGFQPYPPAGTEWSYGSAADWQSLTFRPWDELHDKKRTEIVDKDAVVHLIEEDIYIDVKFTKWTKDGEGSGFKWERAMNDPVRIVSGPTASPDHVSLEVGSSTLSVIAQDDDNDPIMYDWDFGDGETGGGASVTHNYTAPGRYTATVTVSDGSVSVQGTVDVTVNHPPTIDTGPTATPDFVMTGEQIAFDATASDEDDDPLVLNWRFGDDATATGGSVNHTYDTAGDYTATLRVSDGLDVTEGTVDVTVANELVIGKIKGKLNFKKPGKDSLSIKGELDLPPEFAPAGKQLAVDVGGVEATFTLDAKGKAKTLAGSVKVKYSKKTGKWSMKLSLKKGDFAAAWADEGLVNDTVKGIPATLRALVTVDGTVSVRDAAVTYTGKAGKSGKFK